MHEIEEPEMFENDTTFLAYELAYRNERLTGHRADDRDHHLTGRRRRRRTRRTTTATESVR